MSNVTVQEALKIAIDWFDNVTDMDYSSHSVKRKLQMALSELDKCEPVAWMHKDIKSGLFEEPMSSPEQFIPLYTSPQPRDWVGLSDEIKQKLHKEHHLYIPTIELIESACKQLNTKD